MRLPTTSLLPLSMVVAFRAAAVTSASRQCFDLKPSGSFVFSSPQAVRAAAMPADPCIGARWRRLPAGHPSRPLAGARVPPGARSTGGNWLLPASWPDPSNLTELVSDRDERYRGRASAAPAMTRARKSRAGSGTWLSTRSALSSLSLCMRPTCRIATAPTAVSSCARPWPSRHGPIAVVKRSDTAKGFEPRP